MRENVKALVDIILGREQPQPRKETPPIEVEPLHVSLKLSSFSELPKEQLVSAIRGALRSCGELRQKTERVIRGNTVLERAMLLRLADSLSQNSDVLAYTSVLIGYPCGYDWNSYQNRLKRLFLRLLKNHRVNRTKVQEAARRITKFLLTFEYDLGELLQEALDLPDTVIGPGPSELSLLDLLPTKE